MQETLLRVFQDAQRARAKWAAQTNHGPFVQRIVSAVVVDAIRAEKGRSGLRDIQPVDFQSLESSQQAPSAEGSSWVTQVAQVLAVEAQGRIDNELDAVTDDDTVGSARHGEFPRAQLVAALLTLSDLERDLIRLVADPEDDGEGLNLKQAAERLGVTHHKARELVSQAHAHVRALLMHARDGVDDEHRRRVIAVGERTLTRATNKRRYQETRRHLRHCQPCQRVLDAHQDGGALAA